MQALLVCDDTDEAAILSLVLQRAGLTINLSDNLARALHNWPQESADLVMLALRPSILDDQVRRVRQQTDTLLVVIANTPNEDALCRALLAGADWVIARPYSTRLLILQTRALLRRSQGFPLLSLPCLSVGQLTLDPAMRTVSVSGHPVRRLTQLEFRLLNTLMIHRGQILPTSTLVERVWGYDGEGNMELVRGLIRRLRIKVEENPKKPRYILTVPGVGYRFYDPEE